ncbi:MAG: hypothetical protein KA791_02150 [Flavobacteriales bacterium]|nr:hypothetical protein [Flavobacteriales bacterium]
MRDLASRLLAEEMDKGDGAMVSPGSRVCGKLGVSLTKLAGAAGFRSLLSRALSLAQEEMPWLNGVKVLDDGSFGGLREARVKAEESEAERGESILVAQLIGLLIVFIGTPLTMQLLRQAWPHASIRSEDPGEGPNP